jgi:hypothetical protein
VEGNVQVGMEVGGDEVVSARTKSTEFSFLQIKLESPGVKRNSHHATKILAAR